jgi:hypothetical protein
VVAINISAFELVSGGSHPRHDPCDQHKTRPQKRSTRLASFRIRLQIQMAIIIENVADAATPYATEKSIKNSGVVI